MSSRQRDRSCRDGAIQVYRQNPFNPSPITVVVCLFVTVLEHKRTSDGSMAGKQTDIKKGCNLYAVMLPGLCLDIGVESSRQ